jgi:hypothetical protein
MYALITNCTLILAFRFARAIYYMFTLYNRILQVQLLLLLRHCCRPSARSGPPLHFKLTAVTHQQQ